MCWWRGDGHLGKFIQDKNDLRTLSSIIRTRSQEPSGPQLKPVHVKDGCDARDSWEFDHALRSDLVAILLTMVDRETQLLPSEGRSWAYAISLAKRLRELPASVGVGELDDNDVSLAARADKLRFYLARELQFGLQKVSRDDSARLTVAENASIGVFSIMMVRALQLYCECLEGNSFVPEENEYMRETRGFDLYWIQRAVLDLEENAEYLMDSDGDSAQAITL